ncbi:restriction endonuclease subunit S [Nonlabens sp. SY33080]|uniref:restriction endonuclease subunit S n=1 Tax=Nonlabens sp. SY33080 TaxID=2719911 RepID=UPI0014289CA3|nr:restriction endonuclease subunit S [Nonlabens sp. SY33080]
MAAVNNNHITTTKRRVPQLRFKEFEGEWEKKKLGSISTFAKGKGISKSDIVENGASKCIRYGELYTYYNEVISDVISKTNLDLNSLVISEKNDVIIPASGESQLDIATASCVMKDGIALGGDLNIIKSETNGVFLSYYLNSKKKIDIARLSQGISVVHLYSSQLKTLNLNLPQDKEQQKIAQFLTAVDSKLQQLNHKKELLAQYKKGVMQQLFSQQLRFKPDDGSDYPDWEEKPLGEVSYITTGSSNRVDSSLDGEYTFFDRSEDIRTSNIYLFDDEAVIVPGEGQNFIPKYFIGKFDLHQRTYAIMKFENCLGKFIYYHLAQHPNYLLSQSVGSTVKSLRLPMFKKMKINFPSIEEQQKIANYLSAIDTKIETVTQQIEASQQFKKGLLQQMFV